MIWFSNQTFFACPIIRHHYIQCGYVFLPILKKFHMKLFLYYIKNVNLVTGKSFLFTGTLVNICNHLWFAFSKCQPNSYITEIQSSTSIFSVTYYPYDEMGIDRVKETAASTVCYYQYWTSSIKIITGITIVISCNSFLGV